MPDTFLGYLHPNDVAASFHRSLIDLLTRDLAGPQHIGQWAEVRCATGGIPEGRNQLVTAMLATPAEWLFMLDADMGFQPDVLDRLLAVADPAERPMVGGLCFAWREQGGDGMNGFRCTAAPTIFDWVEHADGHRRFTGRRTYPANALVECGATGGACVLIHRSVLEGIAAEHGPTWFDRVRGTDGSLLGEDISFFVRAGALGHRCHVHTGVRTTHAKQLWVGEADYLAGLVVPPATEHVDVLVPVVGRPNNAQPFMDSLRASTGLANVTAICEADDTASHAAWVAAGADVFRQAAERPGSFAAKVNDAARFTSAPWVFIVGDDVRFHPGWLDHAIDVARHTGANVIGTNDLATERVRTGEHATHLLIRRSYIDELGASWDGPGLVCHEGYGHWYVDDEIVTAAKQRGTFAPALGSIVEHLHPVAGKAESDAIYERGEATAKADGALFKRRLSANRGAA